MAEGPSRQAKALLFAMIVTGVLTLQAMAALCVYSAREASFWMPLVADHHPIACHVTLAIMLPPLAVQSAKFARVQSSAYSPKGLLSVWESVICVKRDNTTRDVAGLVKGDALDAPTLNSSR